MTESAPGYKLDSAAGNPLIGKQVYYYISYGEFHSVLIDSLVLEMLFGVCEVAHINTNSRPIDDAFLIIFSSRLILLLLLAWLAIVNENREAEWANSYFPWEE